VPEEAHVPRLLLQQRDDPLLFLGRAKGRAEDRVVLEHPDGGQLRVPRRRRMSRWLRWLPYTPRLGKPLASGGIGGSGKRTRGSSTAMPMRASSRASDA
jgi:hypothetical protein